MSTALRSGWSDFKRGLVMPFEAARLILTRGKLLRLAVLPMLITLSVTVFSLWAGFHWGQGWLAHFWSQPSACDDCSWYQWIWTRLSASAWHLAWVAGILAMTAVAGLLTSRLATFAIMDSLARRVLDDLDVVPDAPAIAFNSLPLTSQFFRAAKRGLILLAGYVVLGMLSLLPGLAVVTTPAGLIWTVLWLHVDNCSYALQWLGPARVVDVRNLASQNPSLTAGFLAASCVIQLIPFVGFAATPIAVGGGCLYVAAARATPVETSSTPALAAA